MKTMQVYAPVFLSLSLWLVSPMAQADTPSDASAMAHLANAAKASAASSYVHGAPTYTAKKAITLDGLMKEVYPNSPLHAAILNKALQAANPKLLNGKASQSISRGATLNIPNHTQLIVDTLAPYAPPVAVASPPSEANSYGSQSSDPSARRLWVRFP